MNLEPIPPVTIPESDYPRLDILARHAVDEGHPVGRFLLRELRRADVCDDAAIPAGTVRLNKWVTFRLDHGWPVESRMLVVPDEYRHSDAQLSVLSPLGAALLGLRTGSRMPYLSIECARHVATVESLDPPLGLLSLLRLAPDQRALTPAFDPDVPDDPGPAAA